MTDDELRAWAWDTFLIGDLLESKRAVLRLLIENAALRKQIAGHVERIAAQSELLSRAAAKVLVMPPLTEEDRRRLAAADDGVLLMGGYLGGEIYRNGVKIENPFDGSTGLTNPVAGRKSEGQQ